MLWKKSIQQLLSYWCGHSTWQLSVWECFSFLLCWIYFTCNAADISGAVNLQGWGFIFLSAYNKKLGLKYFRSRGGRPASSSLVAAGLNSFPPAAFLRLTANTSNGALHKSPALLIWNEVLQPFAQQIPSGSRKWESNCTIYLPMAGFHHTVPMEARASALSQNKHRFLFLAVKTWQVTFSLLNKNQWVVRFSKEAGSRCAEGEQPGKDIKFNKKTDVMLKVGKAEVQHKLTCPWTKHVRQ